MSSRRKKGMFYDPAKHPWLARIVTFKSPKAADKAANRLVRAFKRSRSRERKVEIKRAATLAANRAEAASHRKNLSPTERRRYKKIARDYRRAVREMQLPPKKRR